MLGTGPGAWEKKSAKVSRGKKPAYVYVPSEEAIPTYTHMAVLQLYKESHAKFLISQNPDGVHMKSGFPRAALAELHGDTNIERCSKCRQEYLRDFYVEGDDDHLTGSLCEKCGGALIDTIVNFGEVRTIQTQNTRICPRRTPRKLSRTARKAISALSSAVRCE